MSGRNLITVGVGALAAGLVIASGGSGMWALAAFSAGSTLAGALIGPEEGERPDPDELEITQSTEDVTCSVVFGRARLAGQYIFVGEDDFRSETIYTEAAGGKGGQSGQASGFSYFVPIHYGICMGKIDKLHSIVSSPNYDVLASFEDGLEFDTEDQESFECRFTETVNDSTSTEGGAAVFYAGSLEQGDDLNVQDSNHRGFCWIRFDEYEMTNTTNPRSLLYEVERMPVCLDDEGNVIAGLLTRASTDPALSEYSDANPAAVVWEVLTNVLWGKGNDPALLDQESFIAASNYYARARIGISTAIGSTTVNAFLARVKDIFGLVVWWDGEITRAKCIWDRDSIYSPRVRITAEDFVDTPEFSRPSLASTFNELRLTFINRESDYERELATKMELAHVETVGTIRSTSMDAGEIGTRRAAELIVAAKLREMATARATMTIRLLRTYSGLQPSSFVELVNYEWRSGEPITTFWQVENITDDDQNEEGFSVTLKEDLYATARAEELTDFTAPIPSIDEDIPLETSDLSDGNESDREVGEITPITLWEPNSWASGNKRSILVAIAREKKHVQSAFVSFRLTGGDAATVLGTSFATPIVGTLKTAISAETGKILRGQSWEIELANETEASSFENAASSVIGDTDHFSVLVENQIAIMLIGNEIFRVGFAQEASAGTIEIVNVMRSEIGSEKEAHAIDQTVLFFPVIDSKIFLAAEDLPKTSAVDLLVTPNSAFATEQAEATVAPPSGGKVFSGDSIRPMTPELVSVELAGTTWTIQIRPRVKAGAGSKLSIQEELENRVIDLDGLAIKVTETGSEISATAAAGSSFTSSPYPMPDEIAISELQWTPDNGETGSGLITLLIDFETNPSNFELRSVMEGLESEALTINQP